MRILVIGGGGREHALCCKLAQAHGWAARRTQKQAPLDPAPGGRREGPAIFCAPGNAGTAMVAENVPIAAEDIEALLAFARERRVDLTVVGPEDPLCAGIVDRFTDAGLRIFGPCAAAARLEGDKAFAKRLMRESGVPTAEARIFEPSDQELAYTHPRSGPPEAPPAAVQTAYEAARQYVATRDEGVVVKACGLAKGKGVFVHSDPADALRTLERLMLRRELGEAGARVVIEELLTGPEVSVLALVDGLNIYLLECAADYKRIGEGDTGPNTGGMGAYSPSGLLGGAEYAIIERDIFVPIVDALRREGVVYKGVLYAGLILTAGGPKVLEFNCRFGDPETQPILMRLQSDLIEAIEATVDGRLDRIELRWDERPALCVVMASKGYPGSYEKGKVIRGLDSAAAMADVQVFHAGTAQAPSGVVTAGGRVLGVTALGVDLDAARRRAYEAVERISFEGAYVRRDIGENVKTSKRQNVKTGEGNAKTAEC